LASFVLVLTNAHFNKSWQRGWSYIANYYAMACMRATCVQINTAVIKNAKNE